MQHEYNYTGQITLNEKEAQIFAHLKNTVDTFDLGSTMRVAGGWVRDKLLGLESNDIDIALDNMMGE